MPTFAISNKCTPSFLAAARKDGLSSREPVIRTMVEGIGGKVVAIYWPSSPDWDLVIIAELPDADAAYAIQSFGWATGASQRMQTTQLRTGAEADAAIARQLIWTAPSS